jgi:hypothetical protein
MKLVFDRRTYKELYNTFPLTISFLAVIIAALAIFLVAGWSAG